ncbi:Response regulator rcp1 [Planctomycetes bacterium Pan216]|uniref:Response regulator rcp1 n=1 Tax=Kolteria novifilia TaxID=2527975 RepID=A0A518BCJ4_9BACT|nr:Response regulator rcp1 [Planctomycetes bacterium Pan216]
MSTRSITVDSRVPILLVEDDDVDVASVRRAFRKNDFKNPIFVVHDGSEALDYLRNAGDYVDPSSYPAPGLILLDLRMPGMNGLEFLQAVKRDEELRMCPVVVLSTSREESDVSESYRLGVAGYITKPVDFGEFVEAMGRVVSYWKVCELPIAF